MTVVLGCVLLVVLVGCVVSFMHRNRTRRLPVSYRTERCEVCDQPAAHRLLAVLDENDQGGTMMAADYCAEHCPGGCVAGCATMAR